MEHKKKISALFALLIVIGGLLYGQMPGTTPFSFLKKPTAISCDGEVLGSYCWYLSGSADSCDTACSSHGGCNLTGTRDYAGSGGTNANCIAVLTALGASGAWNTTSTQDYGCHVISSDWQRATAETTTCSSSYTNTQRACACNN